MPLVLAVEAFAPLPRLARLQHDRWEGSNGVHKGVIVMSERTLRHVIQRQLTEFLDDWYRRPENAGRQPGEQDFAAWLARDGRPSALVEVPQS